VANDEQWRAHLISVYDGALPKATFENVKKKKKKTAWRMRAPKSCLTSPRQEINMRHMLLYHKVRVTRSI